MFDIRIPVRLSQWLNCQPYLLLTLASLFWSGNTIVGRWLAPYADAIDINLYRWLLAFFLLLPFCIKPLVKEWRVIRRQLAWIILLSVMGVVVFQSLLYLAFQTTTAVSAALILSVCPIVITLSNALIFREYLGFSSVIGVLISLGGVTVLISHGAWSNMQSLQFKTGDLWMLLASIVWAVYSIALKRKPKQLSSSSLLFSTVIIGLFLLMLASFFYQEQRVLQNWHSGVYINLLYLAVFPSIAAFLCWNRGVALIGSSKAGIFLHLIPFFSALLSFLLLGEGIKGYHCIGAILVFGGIALVARKQSIAGEQPKPH